MKYFFLFLVLPLFISGCAAPTPINIPTPTQGLKNATPLPGYPWWTESVGYEIFVRSFYDTNGDGIGDFNGITQKLDYLNDGDPSTTNDLGITTIWLMPIFPSPSYHGYDVTDYFAVNPQYGTMDDFKRLIDEAHRRGIKVVIDLVLNHTSDQHP
jgi:alpha-amylase